MKLTSPDIKLVAAGSSNYLPNADPNEWNATILAELRDVVDYIALHMYVGNPADNYYNYLSTPMVLEERTQIVKGMIAREMEKADRGTRDPIYIAWDEYNSWYRARTETHMTGERALEEHYNMEDALVIAGFLNVFVRNADIVKMANMAQLVNVIAPIFTNEEGLFIQTIYYPLQLFAQNVKGTSLDVFVDSRSYATEEFLLGLGESTAQQDAVPYLDVSAAYTGDKVIINVINRHKTEAITTDVISQSGDFKGQIEVFEVNGPDVKSSNDFGRTEVETRQKNPVRAKGNVLTYDFPAHSFTQLRAQIK
jgi:alpha-N-arabinofuranosidase